MLTSMCRRIPLFTKSTILAPSNQRVDGATKKYKLNLVEDIHGYDGFVGGHLVCLRFDSKMCLTCFDPNFYLSLHIPKYYLCEVAGG